MQVNLLKVKQDLELGLCCKTGKFSILQNQKVEPHLSKIPDCLFFHAKLLSPFELEEHQVLLGDLLGFQLQ